MPDIEATLWQNEDFRDRGLLVYGIHRGEDPDLLEDFIEQTGVQFPIVRDSGTISTFAFPAGVGYPYPKDVVIGPDLTIHSIRNSFNVDEMEALIDSLLPPAAPAP